ncbi:MAG: hypothetical protein MZV49_07545 [Rhodopseudomonas palustris]|nr:hypothetical protein [Rhodopseudomonas palustris]
MLTVSSNGFGKRTSSLRIPHHRTRRQRHRRDGRSTSAMASWWRRSRSRTMIRSCWSPMAGQLIRCPVEGIRVAGRSTQGVIVFNTADDEHVVSVDHITDTDDGENGNGNGHGGETGNGDGA